MLLVRLLVNDASLRVTEEIADDSQAELQRRIRLPMELQLSSACSKARPWAATEERSWEESSREGLQWLERRLRCSLTGRNSRDQHVR